MTNPRELVERLAEALFLRFWRRNGHAPESLDGQAEAIKLMWRSIAADAIEARDAEITRLREREKVLCESNEHLSIAADVYLTELDNCALNLRRLIAKFGYEDDNITPKDCSEWINARIAESAASSLLKRLDATSTPSGQ